jgi:hypothetical protein
MSKHVPPWPSLVGQASRLSDTMLGFVPKRILRAPYKPEAPAKEPCDPTSPLEFPPYLGVGTSCSFAGASGLCPFWDKAYLADSLIHSKRTSIH